MSSDSEDMSLSYDSANLEKVHEKFKQYPCKITIWASFALLFGIEKTKEKIYSNVNNISLVSGLFLVISVTGLISPSDLIVQDSNYAYAKNLTFILQIIASICYALAIFIGLNLTTTIDRAGRISDIMNILLIAQIPLMVCSTILGAGLFFQFLAIAFASLIFYGWWAFILTCALMILLFVVHIFSLMAIQLAGNINFTWMRKNKEDYNEKMEKGWVLLIEKARKLEYSLKEEYQAAKIRKNQVVFSPESEEKKKMLS